VSNRELAAMFSDRSPGYLLRWLTTIDASFKEGGEARQQVLDAYAEQTRLDFWEAMEEQAGTSEKIPRSPATRWAEVAYRAVVMHNRGICAAALLDEGQAEVLMDVVQRTLANLVGDNSASDRPATDPISVDEGFARLYAIFLADGKAGFEATSVRVEELRSIGQALHASGGVESMQAAFLKLMGEWEPEKRDPQRNDAARLLVLRWDGVGGWRA
jgi:hypothetical protein